MKFRVFAVSKFCTDEQLLLIRGIIEGMEADSILCALKYVQRTLKRYNLKNKYNLLAKIEGDIIVVVYEKAFFESGKYTQGKKYVFKIKSYEDNQDNTICESQNTASD